MYFIRILRIVAREWGAPSGELICKTSHRVLLRHVDFNRHMNQAAYASICEEARIPWLFRSGAWRRWQGEGINPMVGSQSLVYRRELAPFQRFSIDTRAVGMDGRLLVVEQHFLVGQRVHTQNRLKLLLVGADGVLSAEAAAAQCADLICAPLPVVNWQVV